MDTHFASPGGTRARSTAAASKVLQAWSAWHISRFLVVAAIALYAGGSFAQPSRSMQDPAVVRPESAPSKANPVQGSTTAAAPSTAPAAPVAAGSTAAQIVPLGIGGTGQFGTAWYLDLRINQVVACTVIGPDQTLRCVRTEMIR